MTLTSEQATKIKEQLLSQLGNFPEEKREAIREQIETMTSEQIEAFVKENELDKQDSCIFCSIVEGKVPSYKIAESEEGIAILEINPLNKGHTLIIPKGHDAEISSELKSFAEIVAKRINEVCSPKQIHMAQNKIMNHKVIEIKPDYGTTEVRKKASEQELKNLQETILSPPKEKEVIKKETVEKPEEKLPKLKPRIP